VIAGFARCAFAHGVALTALTALTASAGCSLLFEPDATFLGNESVLASASEAAGFVVDGDDQRLERLEADVDSVTFYYRGTTRPDLETWVLRFSPKPGEQDPTALVDLYSHLALVEELRGGFRLGEETIEEIGGATLRRASYEFRSALRGDDGRALVGSGVVAILVRERAGRRLFFVMRSESTGAREALGRGDIEPFVRAMLR